MRAAVFHAANTPMTIETLEISKPGPHEVLLDRKSTRLNSSHG